MTNAITLFSADVRRCGSCSLCCRLLPVRSLDKPANTRCAHQRFSAKGECCKVYAKLPAISPECRLWSCRWLRGQAGKTRRPDQAHYVVDVMPDYVQAGETEADMRNVAVIQVWVDPRHPDAHRDPALRAWIEEQAMPALIRYDDRRGFLLAPPSCSSDGLWHEHGSVSAGRSHSAQEIIDAVMGGNP